MKTVKLFFRFLFRLVKWGLVLIVVLAIASTLYNLTLPKRSEVTDCLTENQKAYIAEMMNLQTELGDSVWPGWGMLQTPVIVYNEEFAFLVGYQNPPAGWFKMPKKEFRGTDWKPLTNDKFFGETYYRQRLNDPNITPESFTATVGDRWVVTMQTKEYAEVAFYNGFRNDLPPVVKSLFPYKLFWNLIMGNAEDYIVGLAHEAFHAFQGTYAWDKLRMGEDITYLSEEYPWFDEVNARGWVTEIDMLMKAYEANDIVEVSKYTKKFLEIRKLRRAEANLSIEQIGFEQKREWLEGLAKYFELTIGVKAQYANNYKPILTVTELKEFNGYKKRDKHFNQQVYEAPRTASRRGDSRFYYVGMLQAVILDRLMPNWKQDAFEDDIFLDNMLSRAVGF